MKRWTKKDVRTLCGCISTFWLYNRPLGSSTRGVAESAEAVRRHLDEHRAEVVLAGLAEHRATSDDRAAKNQETADHFSVHPEVYGKSTPEMIERFSRLAAESQKASTQIAVLASRVETEGLPPEVMAFDPTPNR